MQSKYLIYLILFTSSNPAAAQVEADPGGDFAPHAGSASGENTITVLANGTRDLVENNGQAIVVFTRDEMDGLQGPDLTRLLERSPAVSVTRNGGPGNFTAVRVRGAEGEQLLVLLDGVR